MERMEEKKYRVRVEVATVIELDVWAVHEDEAAAIAEREAVEHVRVGCEDWYFAATEVTEEE